MGRFKTNDERLAKKMKSKLLTKRALLCKAGHHQEDTKNPGTCVHCKVEKITKDCKDIS